MKTQIKRQILNMLDEHRIMTIATNRPDGWPQATVVGFAHDRLILYCFIARDSQKYANIKIDPRVSITLGADAPLPLAIRGLSMAARALIVEDRAEVDHAYQLLLARYPEYKIMPQPIPQQVPLLRITPEIISVLDYSKGFGHTDLVRVQDRDIEDFIESRRHHWSGQAVA